MSSATVLQRRTYSDIDNNIEDQEVGEYGGGNRRTRRPRRQGLSEVSRDLSTTTQEHWAEEDPSGP
jgi:hypothetical protein